MATTLTALVLRGRRYHYAHVGDSRLYRLRGESPEQITTDHVWETPGMSHVLKRALGLDTHVMPDFGDGELRAGDVFLLCSDGVWEPLGQQELHRLLQLHDAPEYAARALVREAHGKGGQDNASALVVRVGELADAGSAPASEIQDLPLPGVLHAGARVDDFVIEALVHESRATLLYRVRHADTGQAWLLKTRNPCWTATGRRPSGCSWRSGWASGCAPTICRKSSRYGSGTTCTSCRAGTRAPPCSSAWTPAITSVAPRWRVWASA
jgi:protein phosphatase